MRLVLGIDEAGYGPRIGPLVVGACLLRVPPAIPAVGGDLWRVFGETALRLELPLEELEPESANKVLIGDSKLLFDGGAHDALESSAHALLAWLNGEAPDSSSTVFDTLGVTLDPNIAWLGAANDRFPLAQTPPACTLKAGFGVKPVMLAARALSAAQYNQWCERSGNKAVVNWAMVSLLIEEALERSDGVPVEIVVDRQGGRVHYEELLRELFGCEVSVLEKSPTRSAYRIDDPRVRSIEFLVGGDGRAFCSAAASIMAKYVRELLMARLNQFFCSQVPDLKPSGGYFSDGNRFIVETEALRAQLGIDDGSFIRVR